MDEAGELREAMKIERKLISKTGAVTLTRITSESFGFEYEVETPTDVFTYNKYESALDRFKAITNENTQNTIHR